MSLKILEIKFESLDQFMGNIRGALFEGKPLKPQKNVIKMGSVETFKKIMSPHRLEILIAIARVKPESIYQLAKFVDREYAHVLKDCKSLETFGFIKLVTSKTAKKQSIPQLVFDYDLIRVNGKLEEILVISEKPNRLLVAHA